ncbi:MAG: outer membrane beta-barrel protein [Bacteroidaceae bacterium]|nr:outer membrane beta-barrel protein [Bacteroidaceae bacterium]
MKKLMMILALVCSVNASAQWFVGGGTNFGYIKDNFQFSFHPQAGYEFNDRWAVGFGLGFTLVNDIYGYAEPYVRFNCWNNDKLFVDVKARAEFIFGHGAEGAQVGLSPSLRYKINDHWQVYGDAGLFGAEKVGGDWAPAFGVGSIGISTGVIYKF